MFSKINSIYIYIYGETDIPTGWAKSRNTLYGFVTLFIILTSVL